MRWSLLAALSASPLILSAIAAFGAAPTTDPVRVSGPVTHENLTVYFIHGTSAPGKAPLTLEEALVKRTVEVRETGNVNQLEIENRGNEPVFIQAGDIVKGGQQDRTLMVSLLLPPKSGRIPIASFCVEQGRWSARGKEDVKTFASSSGHVPSREMKMAMQAPAKPAEPVANTGGQRSAPRAGDDTSYRQSAVWDGVRKLQGKLADKVGAPVAAPESASSLQLALENKKLVTEQKTYVDALKIAGEASDDVIGYVFAINGAISSGDVYPSNALFRKMWAKLLNAGATEAIGHRNDTPAAAPPSIEAVNAFLAAAEQGAKNEKPLTAGLRQETREGEKTYMFETAGGSGFVHRNYLAK
jgi:ARG and Rhodanese-Phosphatase-superfamily-associated Protein domain